MNETEIATLILKGIVADLPESQQKEVATYADRIRAVAAESDIAKIAFALVSAELAGE